MTILLNLAALLLVVAISWFGMMWLAGRVHGKDPSFKDAGFGDTAIKDRNTGTKDSRRIRSGASSLHPSGGSEKPCRDCKGSGARHRMGRLEPCPVCEGTGVHTALH